MLLEPGPVANVGEPIAIDNFVIAPQHNIFGPSEADFAEVHMQNATAAIFDAFANEELRAWRKHQDVFVLLSQVCSKELTNPSPRKREDVKRQVCCLVCFALF